DAPGKGRIQASAVVGTVVVALDQAGEVVLFAEQVIRAQSVQLQGTAQGARAKLTGVCSAHYIDARQAFETDAVQAAVDIADDIVQPGQADAVQSRQDTIPIQSTDIDAVV